MRRLGAREGAARVYIATPAPPGSLAGNRVTALRYARLLRGLGLRVRVGTRWAREACDVLVALHARRSLPSIRAVARARPSARRVVVLTGTDLYGAGRGRSPSLAALDLADRIVVLQPEALKELSPRHRRKARAILQSARPPRRRTRPPPGEFRACVLGHLRSVKDPFRAALASRALPASSRIRVVHLGRALDRAMSDRARAEAARNPRYRWLGEVRHARALAILAGAGLFVQTSRAEGGSIAMAEAIVAGVPLLASRIPGAVGMVGATHPGLFPAGDDRALAARMLRAERDPAFRAALAAASRRLAPRFAPAREREAWRRLLRALGAPGSGWGRR